MHVIVLPTDDSECAIGFLEFMDMEILITGPLCGETIGNQWITLTKGPEMRSFDVSLVAA